MFTTLLYIAWLISATNGSSHICTENCVTNPECNCRNVNCTENEECYVSCENEASCYTSIINCPINSPCNVYCRDYHACLNAVIKCQDSTNCNVRCNLEASCKHSKVYCPSSGNKDGTNKACHINGGTAKESLSYVFIYAIQGFLDVNITCSGVDCLTGWSTMKCKSEWTSYCLIDETYQDRCDESASDQSCTNIYATTPTPTLSTETHPNAAPFTLPNVTHYSVLSYAFYDNKLIALDNSLHEKYSISLYPPQVQWTKSTKSLLFPIDNVKLSVNDQGYVQINNLVYVVNPFLVSLRGITDPRSNNAMFIFDLSTSTYIEVDTYSSTTLTKTLSACVAASELKIYSVGGTWNGVVQKTTQIYDISFDLWLMGPEINVARYWHACQFNSDYSTLFIFGGKDEGHTFDTNTIEMLNINSNEWILLDNTMIQGRFSHDCNINPINRYIYCFGGYDYSAIANSTTIRSTLLSSAEIFDAISLTSYKTNDLLNTNPSPSSVLVKVPSTIQKYWLYIFGWKGVERYCFSEIVRDCSWDPNISTTGHLNTELNVSTTGHLTTEYSTTTTIATSKTTMSIDKGNADDLYDRFKSESVLLYLIISICTLNVILFLLCLLYLLFGGFRDRTKESGNTTWLKTIKVFGVMDIIGIVMEIFDTITDYLFSISLIVGGYDPFIKWLGWISLMVAVIGLVLFNLKYLLFKKLIAFQVIKLLKQRIKSMKTETDILMIEIRKRKVDVDVFSLLIATVEDVPQALISIIVVSLNIGWDVISIINLSFSVISFISKCTQVAASKFGCKDPHSEYSLLKERTVKYEQQLDEEQQTHLNQKHTNQIQVIDRK